MHIIALMSRPIENAVGEVLKKFKEMVPWREFFSGSYDDSLLYDHESYFWEDNMDFVKDVVRNHLEDNVLEWCRERAIPLDECLTDENLEKFLFEQRSLLSLLKKLPPDVLHEVVNRYEGANLCTAVMTVITEYEDEGKFDSTNPEDLDAAKRLVRRLPVSDKVKRYVLECVERLLA